VALQHEQLPHTQPLLLQTKPPAQIQQPQLPEQLWERQQQQQQRDQQMLLGRQATWDGGMGPVTKGVCSTETRAEGLQ
jgi:chitodextrinase